MVDVAMFLSVVVLAALWVWPYDDPTDPYDDPKNWGDQ
jgi:hypothetical protein